MKFVIARDPAARFRFASLQSATGRALRAEHGISADSMILIEAGHAYIESEAACRIGAHLGAPWSWLAAAVVIPAALRNPVYRWVARNRYRWFGRDETCWMPTPELTSRFLDAQEDVK
ncbi:MAG: DCC1-like thiol-disulfide oxidoreductase family protein [Bryobacteraceae bacterium]|nr:DCC1-like thiol-disulfide oxidoreductase family protein [Bryobacteraceae bacterium]